MAGVPALIEASTWPLPPRALLLLLPASLLLLPAAAALRRAAGGSAAGRGSGGAAACHFCHAAAPALAPSQQNKWHCPECGGYNGFTADGDYNKDLLARHGVHPAVQPVGRAGLALDDCAAASPLCAECTAAQGAIVRSMARFEPDGGDAVGDAEYCRQAEAHRAELEQRHALCQPCALAVDETLRDVHRAVTADLMKKSLDRSRASDVTPTVHRAGVRLWILRLWTKVALYCWMVLLVDAPQRWLARRELIAGVLLVTHPLWWILPLRRAIWPPARLPELALQLAGLVAALGAIMPNEDLLASVVGPRILAAADAVLPWAAVGDAPSLATASARLAAVLALFDIALEAVCWLVSLAAALVHALDTRSGPGKGTVDFFLHSPLKKQRTPVRPDALGDDAAAASPRRPNSPLVPAALEQRMAVDEDERADDDDLLDALDLGAMNRTVSLDEYQTRRRTRDMGDQLGDLFTKVKIQERSPFTVPDSFRRMAIVAYRDLAVRIRIMRTRGIVSTATLVHNPDALFVAFALLVLLPTLLLTTSSAAVAFGLTVVLAGSSRLFLHLVAHQQQQQKQHSH